MLTAYATDQLLQQQNAPIKHVSYSLSPPTSNYESHCNAFEIHNHLHNPETELDHFMEQDGERYWMERVKFGGQRKDGEGKRQYNGLYERQI
jgi:hypothetical protein